MKYFLWCAAVLILQELASAITDGHEDHAKFALCLFGSIGKWTKQGEAVIGKDSNPSHFVDLGPPFRGFSMHLLDQVRTDVFIHSWVPSRPLQDAVRSLYRPKAAKFEDNAEWARGYTKAHGRDQLQERSMWTSAVRSVGLALTYDKQRATTGSSVLGFETSVGRGARAVSTGRGQQRQQPQRQGYEWVLLSRPDVLHWASEWELPSLAKLLQLYPTTPPLRANNTRVARWEGGESSGGSVGDGVRSTHGVGGAIGGKQQLRVLGNEGGGLRDHSQIPKVVLNPHVPDFHPEMMCHPPPHACDLTGGADVHFLLSSSAAQDFLLLPHHFQELDLTAHAGSVLGFLKGRGAMVAQNKFAVRRNVATYKMFLESGSIIATPLCLDFFAKQLGMHPRDVARAQKALEKFHRGKGGIHRSSRGSHNLVGVDELSKRGDGEQLLCCAGSSRFPAGCTPPPELPCAWSALAAVVQSS